ncbi:hypothetical protein NDU88_006559 [Pleurodeles waltl]|uniref:Uncharacterized protein n=1 Tax=Pleurodeles waltl TaxID=8319 RepID=A0AAV7N2R0_PLEWA|nr:hypothetical protein NDU88_006559 [Pleurodeles waltl]
MECVMGSNMAPLGSVEVSVESAGHRLPLHTAGLRVSGLSGGALGSPPRVSVRPGDDRASEGPTGGRVASPRSPGFLRRPSACLWVLRGLSRAPPRPLSVPPGSSLRRSLCPPGSSLSLSQGPPRSPLSCLRAVSGPLGSSLGALPRARACDAAEARGRVSGERAPVRSR